MKSSMNRRQFLGSTAIAGAGVTLSLSQVVRAQNAGSDKPALLGGKPVRTRPPREWPIMDEREDKAMLETVRSGKWFRGNGKNVSRFEEAYAKATGAKNCLATNSGTSALFTSLAAVGCPGRRRSHRGPLHLHRHGERDPAAPRAADLRG